MTEPIEFDVPSAGAPNLDAEEGPVSSGPDAFAQQATALMPVPGWTQDEAARVVGGLVANISLAMYAMRWQAAPAPELWPAIAGNPEQEFPLMGAGLAPVLDFLAPKGSPQAVGVSLTAGCSEIIGAMARRWQVINTAPPQARAPARAPDTQPAEPPGNGTFRYRGEQLRVLRDQEAYVGVGIE